MLNGLQTVGAGVRLYVELSIAAPGCCTKNAKRLVRCCTVGFKLQRFVFPYGDTRAGRFVSVAAAAAAEDWMLGQQQTLHQRSWATVPELQEIPWLSGVVAARMQIQ